MSAKLPAGAARLSLRIDLAPGARLGPGKVDLYGWDGYPLGFDCDKPEVWLELAGSKF